jgi:hypothetical protein
VANITKEDFFAAIHSSNILVTYLEQDPDLVELLKNPNHSNIHYPQNHVLAKEITSIYKRRLDDMVSKGIRQNLEAIRQLIAFIEKHPDSEIYDVVFNCNAQHYVIPCGLLENHLQIICVMSGGHIPNELFGEKAK